MQPIVAPLETLRGDYSIYRFTDSIYKVVRFRSNVIPTPCPVEKRQRKTGNATPEHRLEASLSRSRRVLLELALCNPWDWFVTLTIDGSKYDRFCLGVFYKEFQQWIRDQRKQGLKFTYVLVPEKHENGAWHLHGLVRGNVNLVSFRKERHAGLFVPDYLVKNGFYDWPEFRERFGFCSFGRIKNSVAVGFYIVKYITKEQGRMVCKLNAKSYFCSRGLNRAVKHGEVYGCCAYLDDFLTNHYDFCDTGMTKLRDGCDWTFGLEYMDADLQPLNPEIIAQEHEKEFARLDRMDAFIQEMIADF